MRKMKITQKNENQYYLTLKEKEKITILASQNIHSELIIEFKNGKLIVSPKKNFITKQKKI